MIVYSQFPILFTILVLILLVASLFSALETAIVAISEHRLYMLKDKHIWAKYANKLKIALNQVLIFSLFGNSLFNVIFTTVTTLLIADALKSLTAEFVLPFATLLIAFFIVIFSEVIPKIIAARLPLPTLRVIALPLYYVFILAKPLIWSIDLIVGMATSFINFNDSNAMSAAELKAVISASGSPFSGTHQSILLNSLELESMIVKDVLIPLRLVTVIDINNDISSIHKKIYHAHHARIIVVAGSIDNIIGFIHVRDVLALEQEVLAINDLQQIIRPITFVHDFVPIIRQINFARAKKQNIFVVINEYGDILGIACLLDMLATVVGDFTTKAPRQKNLVSTNDEQQLLVDGTMLIRDLNKLYNLEITTNSDVLTINGMVLATLNGIPSIGVCFRKNNLVFEVINVGQYWVERVKIILNVKVTTRKSLVTC